MLLIVLFYVLFVCKCVLYYCRRVSTQLQLTNISNIKYSPCSTHINKLFIYISFSTEFICKELDQYQTILTVSMFQQISSNLKMTGLGHYFCTSATPQRYNILFYLPQPRRKKSYTLKRKKRHPNYSDERVTQCLKFRKDFPPPAVVCIFAYPRAITK